MKPITLLIPLLALFFTPPAPAQTMVQPGPNVYSPHMQMVSGRLKMYYGGWNDAGQTHDLIYRSDCDRPDHCTLERAIKFFAPGTNGSIFNELPNGWIHVNDPAVVDTGTALMMYFTVCPGPDTERCVTDTSVNEIWWAESARDDGLNWSAPHKLLSDAWSPSVVRDLYGYLIMYANTPSTGELWSMNLAPDGYLTAPQRHVTVNNGRRYQNVEVRYYTPLKLWIMVAEGENGIDALISDDGYNFRLAIGHLAGPVGDWATVRTPAMLPDSICWLYAAATKDGAYSRGNKIFAENICGG